ncbi:hypothetical protein QVD17_18370 [Tagetes erecta]|uniref:Cullin family profile domain-containing protein n=1 Tax=Tagetes erecta TaxID=13708 RepID=A0AAD8NWA0_TARER|nr:hypothetical protein QVD17_18370 [Tagetes erecta]
MYDKNLQNGLNLAFEFFINRNPRSAEFISLFVDDKLRKCRKGVSEEDVESVLDKAMMKVSFLHEKDVFEMYYQIYLTKRLLSRKVVCNEAEIRLALKLESEFGSLISDPARLKDHEEFVQVLFEIKDKYDRIISLASDNDISLQNGLDLAFEFFVNRNSRSAEFITLFIDNKLRKCRKGISDGFYLNHGPDLGDGPSLAVHTLTTGSWPTQRSGTCNLPTELMLLCEKFRLYYLGTHSSQRLSWLTSMGTADLKACFGNSQRHELTVSTYQTCVLMLFNNSNRLMYKEVERAIGIPSLDLKRCLQSMACVKGKNVLEKEPMSKDIGEHDMFLVNEMFASKFFKVKWEPWSHKRRWNPRNTKPDNKPRRTRSPKSRLPL